jgi:predicted membrane protein
MSPSALTTTHPKSLFSHFKTRNFSNANFHIPLPCHFTNSTVVAAAVVVFNYVNPFYVRWFISQPHVHSNVMKPTELPATFLTSVKVQCGPQNAAAIIQTNTVGLPLATEIDYFMM